MTFTATPDQVAVRPCPACGDPVEVEANFCPTCGTRQVDSTPRPEPAPEVPLVVPERETMERETMAWVLIALGLVILMLVVSLLLVGRLAASLAAGDGHGAAGAEGDSAAADTMDDYAPLDEAWSEKQQKVADQGAQDDSAGLATAAHDAAAWITVNGDALSAVSAEASGPSAPAYQELVGIYSERYDLLSRIETEASAGATGPAGAADKLAALDDLDAQADAALCTIAGVMRSEGDDPADHLPAGAPRNC
jgi:hypothetical protein